MRVPLHLPEGLQERGPLQDRGQREHGVVDPQLRGALVAAAEDGVQTFIDRERGPGDEDRAGCEQRPQVARLAVTERVSPVGRAARALQRADEQDLGGGVAGRVGSLRQQGAGPADQTRDELEDADPEVRGERQQDGEGALLGGAVVVDAVLGGVVAGTCGVVGPVVGEVVLVGFRRRLGLIHVSHLGL